MRGLACGWRSAFVDAVQKVFGSTAVIGTCVLVFWFFFWTSRLSGRTFLGGDVEDGMSGGFFGRVRGRSKLFHFILVLCYLFWLYTLNVSKMRLRPQYAVVALNVVIWASMASAQDTSEPVPAPVSNFPTQATSSVSTVVVPTVRSTGTSIVSTTSPVVVSSNANVPVNTRTNVVPSPSSTGTVPAASPSPDDSFNQQSASNTGLNNETLRIIIIVSSVLGAIFLCAFGTLIWNKCIKREGTRGGKKNVAPPFLESASVAPSTKTGTPTVPALDMVPVPGENGGSRRNVPLPQAPAGGTFMTASVPRTELSSQPDGPPSANGVQPAYGYGQGYYGYPQYPGGEFYPQYAAYYNYWQQQVNLGETQATEVTKSPGEDKMPKLEVVSELKVATNDGGHVAAK
ncbi:hypothetical protein BC829DRAFT_389556 [Chytridium lagenaria]|nr:hypothetical protein BC829DRAFT_389556 [Chytridium lagenaria]